MKLLTQTDIDAVKPDEFGRKNFAENCYFAQGCSFGECKGDGAQ